MYSVPSVTRTRLFTLSATGTNHKRAEAILQSASALASPVPAAQLWHKIAFAKLLAPPPGFSATDPPYKYFGSWHAAVAPNDGLMRCESDRWHSA